MLETNIDNSKTPLESPSFKLSIKGAIQIIIFSFKVMVIVACKIVEINQCP
jgi:hypothetical protein